MDIFVRGLPDQTTAKQVTRYFRKQLRPYGIDILTFRKLRRQGCGILTVLDIQKAEYFLRDHGPRPQSRAQSTSSRPLRYMNRDIFCAPGHQKPDELLLQTLRHEFKERASQKPGALSKRSTQNNLDRQYNIDSIQCGFWDYEGFDLVYLRCGEFRRAGLVKFGLKNLALVSDAAHPTEYRLDIPYTTVLSIVYGDFKDRSITLTLSQAPKVYRQQQPNQSSVLSAFLHLSLESSRNAKRVRVPGLWEGQEFLLARCLVYRIGISCSNMMRDLTQMLQQDQAMPPNIRWPTSVRHLSTSISIELAEFETALNFRYPDLELRIKFQLHKLTQNGFLLPHTVMQLIPHVVSTYQRSGGFVAAEALQHLRRQIPYAGPETESSTFSLHELISHLQNYEKMGGLESARHQYFEAKHPHIKFVHRVKVTPAGFYLYGPEPETSNRVLRTYDNNIDHFVRVTFCDEDGDQLRFERSVSLEEIFHVKFKKVLENGLRVAGRDFHFLGFSHSSLREQTCWFVTPFKADQVRLDAESIRKRLGDFSAFRCPAKCAARIGQAFSTTDGAVRIRPSICKIVPDIERNNRVFSDGVGTLSSELLRKLWREYASTGTRKPTLYQIRYQGM